MPAAAEGWPRDTRPVQRSVRPLVALDDGNDSGYAVKRGHLLAKPAIPKRPEPEKRLLFATQAQALKLLANLPAHREPAARFALATGARQFNVTHPRMGLG